jgi:hypothetical protein
MLGVSKEVWRKIERGINPPPRKSLLKKFCLLVGVLSYEENQLYSLAKRWGPHEDTDTANHQLLDSTTKPEWREAMLAQNRPDYHHKYWGRPKS